ncbi:nucleotidyltransferase family protein [Ramlibacter monticola]|uniref:Nucleotidyltransferase family protein n=1 Tax=Ramlibacter monticola TaxID=1926872 RepID=A0A937CWQ7_9BURK|nr:nucleotidyltransferase family protein [Ramlibacter monticola]MBL0394654.1 nucleotidyltransferase family protein [Ramlibacter monticola]
MILAAGRGERMRPLTDSCPKPLLRLKGKPLMQYHLEAFGRGGFRDVVVNTAWLGEQIEDHFGHATADDVRIRYSHEGRDFGGALETAGGIARALPLLADAFWIVAGDVYMPDFLFTRAAYDRFVAGGKLAHLFLVPNPPHNVKGDFGLSADGLALNQADVRYTYSTTALFRQAFFRSLPAGNPQGQKLALAPLLRAAMDRGEVSAELYHGAWTDVGTPERLAALNDDRMTP